MRIRLNTELLSGLFGLALAALFFLNRGQVGFLSAVFPNTVLVILTVISVALVARGLLAGEPSTLNLEGGGSVLIGIGVMVLWWVGIRYVGFVTTSVPLFAALALAMKRRAGPLASKDYLIAVAVALVVVGGFFWVFSEVLGIRPFRAPWL
ncbi:tripartite tricarboxylate transporter TctB family protein [Roseibaca sp. Y0-43]|uniref:tripartite tricarboxylate transporter TctB family protein n=1 Tax=Roseibaca sp. Y0-43 TaxID=2816854 RepID=UPI001D0CC2B8|nr:tripartite tricarboxylate transporter TctB family protein [Roseibaca sp. Y0-43]MCC1480287.1 tripartite tricarboxylate transporter TctB family protein [Roseibaca sp. Y0-43]